MIEEIFKQAVLSSKKTDDKHSLIVGTVKYIDGDTCTVDDYEGVRLNAIVDNLASRMTIYPKIGSKVIIGRLEGEDDAFLVRTSEIDRVTIEIEDHLFEMKEGRFIIKKGAITLKGILSDTLTRLQTMVITTPSGPGSLSPGDKLFFEQVNEQVNQILANGT